jgi:streptomycin 6-kinase
VQPARYGLVVAVDTVNGPLIMRSSPDPDGPLQAQVAAALADLGVAPAIHETITTDAGTWTVQDEVRPGIPLAHTDPARVDAEALAAMFRPMIDQPSPVPGLHSIFDWLRDRLEDEDLTELPPCLEPAPASMRRDALAILDDLARSTQPGLCHGDASTWNILACGSSRWMLIDPRAVHGEVAYDVAVLALKITRGEPTAFGMERLVEASNVDLERTRAWMRIADAARV